MTPPPTPPPPGADPLPAPPAAESARPDDPSAGAGPGESRAALLVAARRRFAEHGFERTTMRAVARDVGVDPALIYHYFPGGKKALLAATLTMPPGLAHLMAGIGQDPQRAGSELVARALDVWDNHDEIRQQGVATMRIAVGSEMAGSVVRSNIQGFVLSLVGGALRDDHRELRAGLVMAHMQGMLLHRYVLLLQPLASAPADQIVHAMGPVLQHYITGDLGSDTDPAG